MKYSIITAFSMFLIIICATGCRSTGCAGGRCHAASDAVYQTATISSLMQGVYDSPVTWDRCRRHGDTGLGTFGGLDGEMAVIDGRCYKIRADGSVAEMDGKTTTPFLTLTFFDCDESAAVPEGTGLQGLKTLLDRAAKSQNYPWAVRIDGVMARVMTRSVPRQAKPYQPLVKAVENQSVFEYKNISGSIVGFRFPEYAKGINVPGWHLHFISQDRTRGGHLLEVTAGPDCVARLDKCTAIVAELPETEDFSNCAQPENQSDQAADSALAKVEQGEHPRN